MVRPFTEDNGLGVNGTPYQGGNINEQSPSPDAAQLRIEIHQDGEESKSRLEVMESERSESIVIVNEPGGADIRLKQMQSFQSQGSKIIVGGGSLVSPNRE
jgi:hypothetical protein